MLPGKGVAVILVMNAKGVLLAWKDNSKVMPGGDVAVMLVMNKMNGW